MRCLPLLPAALGALVLSAGCALTPQKADLTEFRGRYTAGFEVSRFVACDVSPSDQPWWVILSDMALRQRDSLAPQLSGGGAGAEVFVRWRGVAGPTESAGHLGRSTRYLHVAEILELRPVQESDCGESRRVFPALVPSAPPTGASDGG